MNSQFFSSINTIPYIKEALAVAFFFGLVWLAVHFYWPRIIVVGGLFALTGISLIGGFYLGLRESLHVSFGHFLLVALVGLFLFWFLDGPWKAAKATMLNWVKKNPPSQFGLFDRI